MNDPATIRWVVACIANPASTGLASIAGRVHPVDRNEPGGVLIRLGPGGRRVRVPLAPGTFTTLDVESVEPLTTSIDLPGGGVLAFDGERTTPVSADATITVSIEASGPRLLDVDTTLALAAADRRFDVGDVSKTAPHDERTSMATEFIMPKLGLTMEEGTITEWFADDGDAVTAGAALLRIETDKTETDVEAAGSGTTPPAGPGRRDVRLRRVDRLVPRRRRASPDSRRSGSGPRLRPHRRRRSRRAPASAALGSATTGRIIASPMAKRLAAERNLDLRTIRGTGPGGRIVAEDLDGVTASATAPAAARS